MGLFLTLINLKIHWIWLQIFTEIRNYLKMQKNEQCNIKILSNKLRKYNPTKAKKIKAKEETLNAA